MISLFTSFISLKMESKYFLMSFIFLIFSLFSFLELVLDEELILFYGQLIVTYLWSRDDYSFSRLNYCWAAPFICVLPSFCSFLFLVSIVELRLFCKVGLGSFGSNILSLSFSYTSPLCFPGFILSVIYFCSDESLFLVMLILDLWGVSSFSKAETLPFRLDVVYSQPI